MQIYITLFLLFVIMYIFSCFSKKENYCPYKKGYYNYKDHNDTSIPTVRVL